MSRRETAWAVVVAVIGPLLVACADDGPPAEPTPAASSPSAGRATEPPDGPTTCVGGHEATRPSIGGEVVWVRFCPGRRGFTNPAEIPSDALTTHLGTISDLTPSRPGPEWFCDVYSSRSYRMQIGYADGRVAQVQGPTDPDCSGTLRSGGSSVGGPAGLGVYGVVMSAFGRQYAGAFETTADEVPLTCPDNPRRPGSVDADGASAGLETGYQLGRRQPMLMPLTAERGIVCRWPFRGAGKGEGEPTVRPLSPADAERVRVGMHAILTAMVDCPLSRAPTYTAVVEDRTGTRRAVTVVGSECSTVIRSKGGYGLGFRWLDPA